NIKFGKSMLLMLEDYKLKSPPLLSIHANVFSICRWNKIFIAGKAGPVLILPDTELGWMIFLKFGAQAVYNLVKYYHAYAKDAAYKIAAHAFESKAKSANKAAFQSSGREIELLEWFKLVMHSPTKLKPVKELVGISKPDNKRFQRLMQEAMAEIQKDEPGDDEINVIDDLNDGANDTVTDDGDDDGDHDS
ncbi:hypothetical protein BGX27_002884, partial [Mortierella sp. AM989]